FVRQVLIFLHRYFGIALSLLFVVWFVSGIVMIYAKGMPELTAGLRLQRLPPINFLQIHLSPSQAAERGGAAGPPPRALLLTIMGRPAYRFSGSQTVTVFADNGDVMPPPGVPESLSIASDFLNVPKTSMHFLRTIMEPDQWTIGNRRQLPLHQIAVDDAAHTQVYVSRLSGEVAMVTTRGSRALAWVSAIPHWLYLESLRRNGSLWQSVVLWTSGLGTILALMGMVLAVIQYSRRRPHIPYAGWMRWHYITGAVFGVFTLTWVFSGFLSMEPWNWASEGGLGDGMREAYSGGPLELAAFPTMDRAAWELMFPNTPLKEIEFLRIQGIAYFAVRGNQPEPVLVSANPLQIHREPFSRESLVGKAREANPDVPIANSEELSHYDSYYYARGGEAPLPVLRIQFDDPDKTWFYIDPKMGRILARFQARERLQRWIYHGLHSLDFSFWYYNRPLWDIGVIVLCCGGAALSAIGVVISFRRIRRDLRRIVGA
ncbi:MAG TPA: PepSY domain-containing protein, partial [Terriglobia bacterium]|nr:PepSY domain-containing protein [Terriglobia bacterium]